MEASLLGGKKIITLTKAQYDALSSEAKAADVIYYITDDTTSANDSVYYTKTEVNNLLTNVNGFGQATEITSGTDLDTLMTPGAYYCPNSTIAGTLINCPILSLGFSLLVTRKTAGDYPEQLVICADRMFTRHRVTSGWTAWVTHGNTENLQSIILDNLGSFATLAEFEALLDTKLASMSAGSTANICVKATGSVYPFANGSYYSGTLYKPLSTASYSQLMVLPTSFSGYSILARRDDSKWVFNHYQLSYFSTIPANSSRSFNVSLYAQATIKIVGYTTSAIGEYLICRSSNALLLQVPIVAASVITIAMDSDGIMTISNTSEYSVNVQILSIGGQTIREAT